MTKKKQDFDWYGATVFVLSFIGWVFVIRLALAFIFGLSLFGPLFLK